MRGITSIAVPSRHIAVDILFGVVRASLSPAAMSSRCLDSSLTVEGVYRKRAVGKPILLLLALSLDTVFQR